jgi:hypothetical protein
MFLKLYGKQISESLSKDASIYVLDELLLLQIECMNHQIRAIGHSLTWLELILDPWPGWICSHGDKEIAPFEVAIYGQFILKKLLHVTCALCKGRRQDNPLTERLCVCINICSHCIGQARVHLTMNGVLIQHDEAQPFLLSL